ncbi:hypothetical protein LUX39_07025 [Actinomadura madurae]|nr:hypothetical protein [Actinomadura madurae]MCQ0013572.1 hypothetical protein [Actinomadura madurae]
MVGDLPRLRRRRARVRRARDGAGGLVPARLRRAVQPGRAHGRADPRHRHREDHAGRGGGRHVRVRLPRLGGGGLLGSALGGVAYQAARDAGRFEVFWAFNGLVGFCAAAGFLGLRMRFGRAVARA